MPAKYPSTSGVWSRINRRVCMPFLSTLRYSGRTKNEIQKKVCVALRKPCHTLCSVWLEPIAQSSKHVEQDTLNWLPRTKALTWQFSKLQARATNTQQRTQQGAWENVTALQFHQQWTGNWRNARNATWWRAVRTREGFAQMLFIVW